MIGYGQSEYKKGKLKKRSVKNDGKKTWQMEGGEKEKNNKV